VAAARYLASDILETAMENRRPNVKNRLKSSGFLVLQLEAGDAALQFKPRCN